MPITFDEVTADIAPPPQPADPGAATPAAGGGEAGAQRQLRESLALLQERAERLFAD